MLLFLTKLAYFSKTTLINYSKPFMYMIGFALVSFEISLWCLNVSHHFGFYSNTETVKTANN